MEQSSDKGYDFHNIRNEDGSFKSAYQVLSELAEIYQLSANNNDDAISALCNLGLINACSAEEVGQAMKVAAQRMNKYYEKKVKFKRVL